MQVLLHHPLHSFSVRHSSENRRPPQLQNLELFLLSVFTNRFNHIWQQLRFHFSHHHILVSSTRFGAMEHIVNQMFDYTLKSKHLLRMLDTEHDWQILLHSLLYAKNKVIQPEIRVTYFEVFIAQHFFQVFLYRSFELNCLWLQLFVFLCFFLPRNPHYFKLSIKHLRSQFSFQFDCLHWQFDCLLNFNDCFAIISNTVLDML